MEVPEIDLILGGHDHIIYLKKINETMIMKSGSNFFEFHYLTLDFEKKLIFKENSTKYEFNKFNLYVEKVSIDKKFEENEELKKFVDNYLKETETEMEKVIKILFIHHYIFSKTQFYAEIPLDTRFSIVRSQETGICNFFADLMRHRYDGDVTILNNGFLRSDCIFDAGKISFKMMIKMVPVLDNVCLLEVTGKVLLEALENGVSKYPSYDGRFASVSGISFMFDPNLPPYNRIIKESIRMQKGEFKEENLYKLVVKEYLVKGLIIKFYAIYYYFI